MNFAVILKPECSKDARRRQQLMEEIGAQDFVRRVDGEMAANGLILVSLEEASKWVTLDSLDGVAAVEGMGVKTAW